LLSIQLYRNNSGSIPYDTNQPCLESISFLAQLYYPLCFSALRKPSLSFHPLALGFSPEAAWHNAYHRIVAQALDLSSVSASHDIDQIVIDHEPYRGSDGLTILPVSLKVYVLVLGKFGELVSSHSQLIAGLYLKVVAYNE